MDSEKVIFGLTKNEAIEKIYEDTVDNLSLLIQNKYETMTMFCDEHNISRFNLSKVFNKRDGVEMGVSLYMRCLHALGYISDADMNESVLEVRVSLKDYLMIDNNLIMKSTMLIQY